MQGSGEVLHLTKETILYMYICSVSGYREKGIKYWIT